MSDFWRGFWRGAALGPLWKYLDYSINGVVTMTLDEEGNCVAVSRQDPEGRILSVIWEKK